MTEKVPFLSVITVSFNAMDTLPQTLASLANQDEKDFEHIIVDGGSKDGTVAFLQQQNDPNLRWISEADTGIYNAMNKGISMARGEVISFLNADDSYFPDTISSVKKAFQTDTDIVYGNLRKERLLHGKWHHRTEFPDLQKMPQTMGIFHPATFIRKTLFDQLGLYDEQYRFSADYEWLLRAYLSGARFYYLNQTLAIFRVGGVSTLNCASYEEGLAILERHQTGFENEMRDLVQKCKKKILLRRLISNLAKITGTTGLLERRMAKNWTPNHGGFGA